MSTAMVDYLERLVFTFLQAMLGVLVIGDAGIVHANWLQAVLIAAFATACSAVTSLLAVSGKLTFADPLLDMTYRTLITFVQTVLGVMIAAGTTSIVAFDWAGACRVGFVAAMAALAKAIAGALSTQTHGASALVKIHPTRHAPRKAV